MNTRALSIVAACLAALVAALPAASKTPPPSVVANVGVQVAQLGLAAGRVDTADSKCSTAACLSKSYNAFYAQARTLDRALEALWNAAGRSGACAAAAANAGAGFDSLTKNYHSLEAALLKNDKAAANAAYGQINAKTPRLTAVVSSFKTKCR